MTTRDGIPDEILLMRRWLGDVFTQASRGLPWPQQAALRLIEQALAMGMFGGLLSSGWLLQEFQARSSDPSRIPDLSRTLQALQEAAIGPLPGPVIDALRLLTGSTGPLMAALDLFPRTESRF